MQQAEDLLTKRMSLQEGVKSRPSRTGEDLCRDRNRESSLPQLGKQALCNEGGAAGELEMTLTLDKKDRSATLFSVWGWEISGANLEFSPREDRVSAEGACSHGLHILVLTD